MAFIRNVEAARLIQGSKDVIATSRQIIARSTQGREKMRSVIRETRRVIESSRADRAKREG